MRIQGAPASRAVRMAQPKGDGVIAEYLDHRDRAILEVLYATGLRVSELIGLRPGDLDMQVGVLTCFGKGRKERLVPLGRTARKWVQRYLEEVRGALTRLRPSAAELFLSQRGGHLSRMG